MKDSQHADAAELDTATQTGIPANTHIVYSNLQHNLNRTLFEGFLRHRDDADIKRTHLFHGRYENIYLTAEQIPELEQLVAEACDHASRIAGINDLKAGYWFNYMPPGAVTTAHSHDDDDELLSAVYYIRVPDNSGQLLIHDNDKRHVITPREGMFVFFAPDVVHEVSSNMSTRDRLSIAFNFGRRRDAG
ncbi:MAG: hypothetical protein HKO86_02725 [Gammaproteobacteria bacterium]|nr:hypothetical protein [Gammaproteobacteria bacterium]